MKKLVREHISEGVADKWYENKLGLEQFPGFDQRYAKKEEKDSLIGYMTKKFSGDKLKNPVAVYKNPSSLKNYLPNIRGVIIKNGDFYVANSLGVIHVEILRFLKDTGIITTSEGILSRWEKVSAESSGFLTVQRFEFTNEFYIGESYEMWHWSEGERKHKLPGFEKYMIESKKKNPLFKFIPKNIDSKYPEFGMDEGVADKWYENKLGIEQFPGFENKWAIEQSKPIGYIMKAFDPIIGVNKKLKIPAPVFKNPESLNGIYPNARGIIDNVGNLYICNTDDYVLHDHMLKFLEKLGILKYDIDWADEDIEKLGYITIQRDNATKDFYIGESNSINVSNGKHRKKIRDFQVLFDKCKILNPQYDFIMEKIRFDDVFEGVGDKFLANKYITPDDNEEFEKIYKSKKQKEEDKPITYIKDRLGKITPVFKNPKNLFNFDRNVRAIADKEGNLYVALEDNYFNHGKMANYLNTVGIINCEKYYENNKNNANTNYGIYANQSNYLLLNRKEDTNTFGVSDAYEHSGEASEDMFKALRKRNPQYDYEERFEDWYE